MSDILGFHVCFLQEAFIIIEKYPVGGSRTDISPVPIIVSSIEIILDGPVVESCPGIHPASGAIGQFRTSVCAEVFSFFEDDVDHATFSIGVIFGGRVGNDLDAFNAAGFKGLVPGVFAHLPARFTVNRYHSLAIRRSDCPAELEVTAWTDDGEIMGVKHKTLAIEGVQFHPESILTEHGHAMLKNFLEQAA